METMEKLKFIRDFITDFTIFVYKQGDDYMGQVEVETYEDTLYLVVREGLKSDVEGYLDVFYDYIVRDNGNGNVKFMITMKAQ